MNFKMVELLKPMGFQNNVFQKYLNSKTVAFVTVRLLAVKLQKSVLKE